MENELKTQATNLRIAHKNEMNDFKKSLVLECNTAKDRMKSQLIEMFLKEAQSMKDDWK